MADKHTARALQPRSHGRCSPCPLVLRLPRVHLVLLLHGWRARPGLLWLRTVGSPIAALPAVRVGVKRGVTSAAVAGACGAGNITKAHGAGAICTAEPHCESQRVFFAALVTERPICRARIQSCAGNPHRDKTTMATHISFATAWSACALLAVFTASPYSVASSPTALNHCRQQGKLQLT